MRYVSLILSFVFLFALNLNAQVKINEVLYSTSGDQIELKNFGSSAVDVSDWWFCSLFIYDRVGDLTVESGDLNIPAGGILVVSGKSLNDSASDLGLYTSQAFSSSAAMEDFVQWGSGGQGRENVAVTKGIWTAGNFVATVESGHSIEYDGTGDGASEWFDQENPTLGSENDFATSIESGDGEVPTGFSLAQNFPNPFNPATTIRYSIPQDANLATVRLEIFNALGQKVRTLVNQELSAGTYTAEWDGRDDSGRSLASGFYLYRLQAGEFSSIRKMVLMQ